MEVLVEPQILGLSDHEAHRFVPRVTHEARRGVSEVMHRHAATLVQSNGVRWWFVGVLAELGVQASDFVKHTK